MFIEGNRLYIRLLTEDDATQTYLDWMNDEEINQFLESRWKRNTLDDIMT